MIMVYGQLQESMEKIYFMKNCFLVSMFLLANTFIIAQPSGPKDVVNSLIQALSQKEPSIHWIDVEGLSQRCLGNHVSNLSEAQVGKFKTLLETLFQEVAFPKSADFFKDLEIEFLGENINENLAIISTSLFHPDEGLIDIDYRLERVQNSWLIVDVSLDGVSLARNIQNQVRKIMDKEGFEELIIRMNKKIENKSGV